MAILLRLIEIILHILSLARRHIVPDRLSQYIRALSKIVIGHVISQMCIEVHTLHYEDRIHPDKAIEYNYAEEGQQTIHYCQDFII